MPKREIPINNLEHFIPPGTYPQVYSLLYKYKIHLTVTQNDDSGCIIDGPISVNGNLNTYAFLIDLLHKISHQLALTETHDDEWKYQFSTLLEPFIQDGAFPEDIKRVLIPYNEDKLKQVLKLYDPLNEDVAEKSTLGAGMTFLAIATTLGILTQIVFIIYLSIYNPQIIKYVGLGASILFITLILFVKVQKTIIKHTK
jgi:hypothetical protein